MTALPQLDTEYAALAARVAKRLGFASRNAYLRGLLRRMITRDARRLGLLDKTTGAETRKRAAPSR